mmetsp:Transcript_68734/g.110770  ORF Transcript_68734/g.110770 Transcript_68734/m.110770 type:complete len:283 (-) Transcript_68734:88-936(-)
MQWPWGDASLQRLQATSHGQLQLPEQPVVYCPERHGAFWRPDHLLRLAAQCFIGPSWLRYFLVSGVSGSPKNPQVHYHSAPAIVMRRQAIVVLGAVQLVALACFGRCALSSHCTERFAWSITKSLAFVTAGSGAIMGRFERCCPDCQGTNTIGAVMVHVASMLAQLWLLLSRTPFMSLASGGVALMATTCMFWIPAAYCGLTLPRRLLCTTIILAMLWVAGCPGLVDLLGLLLVEASSIAASLVLFFQASDRSPAARVDIPARRAIVAQLVGIIVLAWACSR